MQQTPSLPRFLKVNKNRLIFFLAFILTCALLFFSAQYFTVRVITVSSTDESMRLIGIESFYGKNIFILSTRELENTIYENNPAVYEVRIVKQYPQTIGVRVRTTIPQAYLAVDSGYFLLAGNGRILQKSKEVNAGLPVIHYYQKLHYSSHQAGAVVDLKDIKTALYFLDKVRSLGLAVTSIDINGYDMIRLQLEKKMVIFTTEKKLSEQDYQLDTLIRQFKVEGRDFKTLDLRFEKPIVTLE